MGESVVLSYGDCLLRSRDVELLQVSQLSELVGLCTEWTFPQHHLHIVETHQKRCKLDAGRTLELHLVGIDSLIFQVYFLAASELAQRRSHRIRFRVSLQSADGRSQVRGGSRSR